MCSNPVPQVRSVAKTGLQQLAVQLHPQAPALSKPSADAVQELYCPSPKEPSMDVHVHLLGFGGLTGSDSDVAGRTPIPPIPPPP